MTAPREKTLALIPARAGSKGVPDKNLRLLSGISLTAHAIRCARETKCFDRIVVSTDSDRIAANAEAEGAEVLRRPAELASDTADVVDVIAHVLEVLAQKGFHPEVVALLEPSSPLRTPAMVQKALAALVSGDAVFTVTEVPLRFHAAKQFAVDRHRSAEPFLSGGTHPVRRQELTPTFIRNGAAYAFRTHMFLAHQSVLGPAPQVVVIEEPLVNIDTIEDLAEAERLISLKGMLA